MSGDCQAAAGEAAECGGVSDPQPLELLRIELMPDEKAPRRARMAVKEAAVAVGQSVLDGVVLAVSELVTNAVRHGAGSGSCVELAVSVEGPTLVVEVRDDGGAGGVSPRRDPGGFGLRIVDALADRLDIYPTAGWRVVAAFAIR